MSMGGGRGTTAPSGFRRCVPDLAAAAGRVARVNDSSADAAPDPLVILVYSDDANTRAEVMLALGRRPHPDLPAAEYVEVATEPVVVQQMDSGRVDLAILDGEAVPAGGLGIAKQMKDEIYHCPPILVLTGRPQDAWLATWSRADAAVPHPLDPMQLSRAVAGLLSAVPSRA
jgi:DNA-binding response OmpR family regulator